MSLAEELRKVPTFEGLSPEGLEWLASQMTEVRLSAGEVFYREGAPADQMCVLLEGELRSQPSRPEFPTWVVKAPTITGMLPFSRMTHYPSTVRAVLTSRVALYPAARFPEMLEQLPLLQPRLVNVLADRVRRATQMQDQTEKLAALGKISAGLAHELNNPAAAARRAAGSLREAFHTFRNAAARLDSLALSAEQRALIPVIEQKLAERNGSGRPLDSLERSDCEEAVAGALERHGVARAWELAPMLVDAGCESAWLDRLASQFPNGVLSELLSRIAASLLITSLLAEVENSTGRISDLVLAIKQYTYMDRGPEQEVDIHQSLENTLLIFHHRLKHGITVKLDLDRSLPRICGRGSALTQVWTNLIDNAIDAMQGKGELHIRTSRELDSLLVEIGDNGPGIPAAVRDRLFEPFFTTKEVGKGTGLGLETAGRIVRDHGGEITVESVPGDTRFQIRLPLNRAAAAETKSS
ncbi:MAG: ATP-binding protein [Bryobacteraceae bacterium]